MLDVKQLEELQKIADELSFVVVKLSENNDNLLKASKANSDIFSTLENFNVISNKIKVYLENTLNSDELKNAMKESISTSLNQILTSSQDINRINTSIHKSATSIKGWGMVAYWISLLSTNALTAVLVYIYGR